MKGRKKLRSCVCTGLAWTMIVGLLLLSMDRALGQGGHSLGRSTGGIQRLQAERGIEGRFPSSRLTLEPEEYEGLVQLPHLGVFRLLPYYQFATAFSDNVFLTHTDRKWDWIFDNSLGVMMTLTGKQHLFELNYVADILTHANWSNFDRGEHDLDARLTIKPTRNLKFTAENEFMVSYVTPRYPTAISPTGVIRYPDNHAKMFFENVTSVTGEYQFGKKFSAELSYTHDNVDFAKDRMFILDYSTTPPTPVGQNLRDSNFSTDALALDLYYRILPKTRLFAEYAIIWTDNTARTQIPPDPRWRSTDNVRHQVSGGAAWDPTAKLRGRIHGGFEWVDYIDLPMSMGPYYAGELEYDYSRRLRFGLRLLQTITETSPVAGNVAEGRNFQSTNLSLRATYKLTRNLDWHVEGFLIRDDFGFDKNEIDQRLRTNRKDTLLGVETGFDWRLRRNVIVGISYQYQHNDAKGDAPGVELNSFRENLLTLYLSLVF